MPVQNLRERVLKQFGDKVKTLKPPGQRPYSRQFRRAALKEYAQHATRNPLLLGKAGEQPMTRAEKRQLARFLGGKLPSYGLSAADVDELLNQEATSADSPPDQTAACLPGA